MPRSCSSPLKWFLGLLVFATTAAGGAECFGQDSDLGTDKSSTSSEPDDKAVEPVIVSGKTEQDILGSLPPDVLAAGEKAKAEFQELKQKLSATLLEMRKTYIRYQNDEVRNPVARDRYRQTRNDARDLMNQMFESGLDVIRQMPDQEVLQYVLTIIEHRLKHGFYDLSSMEAGARLIDGGFRNPFLFPATMRAAIVGGDFTLARKLSEALDVEKLEEPDQKLIFYMDELEKQFKSDQEIQAKDDVKNNNPRAKMFTTRGEVTIELFINQAPSTVANFIQLAEKGYFDGLDFYQVIDDLLALTGDESGTGEGHTGKFLVDEHDRPDSRYGLYGSLVMAKHPLPGGDFVPNSASAQFAILLLPVGSVSEKQTVFGRVIKGMDVISELRRVDPSKKKEKTQIVLPPDRVMSIEMIRRPEELPEVKYFDPRQATPEMMAPMMPPAN
ncbi:peptidylprolyl isomerase [Stieleria marina]